MNYPVKFTLMDRTGMSDVKVARINGEYLFYYEGEDEPGIYSEDEASVLIDLFYKVKGVS